MSKLSLLLILLVSLLAAPAAAQQSEPQTPVEPVVTPQKPAVTPPQKSVRDRVVFLLSGYEYFPSRADLDGVAPPAEVAALLRELALDVDGRPTLRLRAVDALGYYDDAETIALLGKLCTDRPKVDLPRKKLRTAGLLRHHAITALVRVRKGESVAVMEPILALGDLQLSLTVVHALGKHGGKDGRAALRRLMEQSQDEVVRREAAKWVK